MEIYLQNVAGADQPVSGREGRVIDAAPLHRRLGYAIDGTVKHALGADGERLWRRRNYINARTLPSCKQVNYGGCTD